MRPDDPSPARPTTADVHPDRIGGYRVLRVLGEGGMGVVYLAEQTEPVRREVALKILKLGMDTRQIVARFEAERQALAVMEHPGIAKVYDAGATDAGRPYFVMERVAGVPITEYADTHRLGVRDRVQLLAQVCRAVQHAHQKGVIHRDLKPSNVLITEADDAPQCKIIDFGIARAVEQAADDRTRLTQVEQSLGTPAYMSPEQVDSAGRDIDTRSDIYSLGVLLYELLAGVLPFEARAYRGWAFFAQHMVGEPPAPGLRYASLEAAAQARIATLRDTEPASLRRQLRGELDWVVMRALEKDRDRRYETANGLTRDLERFLANEPVAASPPSRAYRAGKFVRRHRAGVAFAAVVAVLLVGFAGAMGVQAERVARARDLAVVRQGQAEDLIGFMLGDLWQKLEPVGRLEILNDIGDRSVAYFAQVGADQLSDEELSSRARMLYSIGSVRMRQGNLAEAIHAFEESLRLARELSGRAPDDPQRLYDLGQSEFWVGYGRWRETDYEAAASHYVTYRDLSLGLVDRDSANITWLKELGYSHTNLAWVENARGNVPAAVNEFRRALAVKQQVLASVPEDADLRYDVARAHYNLAQALRSSGDLLAAERELDVDLAVKEELLLGRPDNAVWRSMLVGSLQLQGELRAAMGQTAAAVQSFEVADTHLDALLRNDGSNQQWRRDRSFGGIRRAELLIALGRTDQARALLAPAATAMADLMSGDERRLELRHDLARARYVEALVALHTGRPAYAVDLAQSSAALLDDASDGSQIDVQGRARALLLEGRAQAAAGDAKAARPLFEHALSLTAQYVAGSDDPRLLSIAAEALLGLERRDEAGELLTRLGRSGYRDGHFVTRVQQLGYAY